MRSYSNPTCNKVGPFTNQLFTRSVSFSSNLYIIHSLTHSFTWHIFLGTQYKKQVINYLDYTGIVIDTHESTQLYKSILSSFHSFNIRKASKMGKINGISDRALAQEYYDQTIACLQSTHSLTHSLAHSLTHSLTLLKIRIMMLILRKMKLVTFYTNFPTKLFLTCR